MEINEVTERIIGCAIEVHRVLGGRLLESTYQAALRIEFDLTGLKYRNEVQIPAEYKGHLIGHYRIDFIVEECVIVEIKAVDRFDPVFESQILTYLRVTKIRVGLLINFNSRLLKDGIRRFIM